MSGGWERNRYIKTCRALAMTREVMAESSSVVVKLDKSRLLLHEMRCQKQGIS